MTRRFRPKGRERLPAAGVRSEPISELSRHLLRAQEEERKRISRELHDETGQGLMVLRLYLGMLTDDVQNPEAQARLQEAVALLDRTVEGVRRIIGRLSPRTLEELGLGAAIRKEARDLHKHTGIKARLDLPENLDRLDREVEAAIYRSAQETLHNVAKHSQAKNVTVELVIDKFSVCLQVDDDGVGMPAKRGSRRQSFGLMGLRDRVAGLGGTVRIRSRAGRGTRLRVLLPIPRLSIVRKHTHPAESHAPVDRPSPASSLSELKRNHKTIPILAGRAATSTG